MPSPAPFGAHAPTGFVRRVIGITRALPDSWAAKRLGFFLRRLAIRRLRGQPVDAESFGARFRLHPFTNVCEKRILFAPRDFDQAERDFLLTRLGPRFVFVDVGANIGGYSLAVAAAAGADARIVAIEPQPVIFERLAYNISVNPSGRVKALRLAVADREGEVTLFLDRQNQGEASVKIISAEGAGQVRVAARPLLAILEDEGFDHVDAMKLDVEGAEDFILQRFFGEAPEPLWPRVLIIEKGESRWGFDLLGLLAEKGYRTVRETRNNRILER